MPKIQITEIDKTGVVQGTKISNTVFIPMLDTSADAIASEITLLKSVTDLDALVKGKTNIAPKIVEKVVEDKGSLGYRLAKHTLNVGLNVLAQIVPSASAIDWERLADKSLYDVRFLTLGDTQVDSAITDDEEVEEGGDAATPAIIDTGDENEAVVSSMTIDACAKNRGDCVALLNVPVGYNNYKTDIAANTLPGMSGISNGEYAAAFVPNFKTLHADLVDTDNTEEEIPAAFGYIFAYANMIKNNPEWYAVAGFQRGIIPELTDVCYDLSGGEIDLLQKRDKLDSDDDNVGVAINPIANIRPAGYIIYGNRTMRNNDAAKKTTAQSFLNVRNLVSAIKKQTYNAARTFTFEPNNELLWVKFKAYIEPLLEDMQGGNGILGYKFVRLNTTAKARLRCRLVIMPIEAVEDFEIDIILSDSLSVNE